MATPPMKRKRESSPVAHYVYFRDGEGDAQKKMPNVNKLTYHVGRGKVPERCTNIGQLFPNVTTFKYFADEDDAHFQASFLENVPSMRHFVFVGQGNAENAEYVAAFINENPQLTRLKLRMGNRKREEEIQSMIDWHKLQNITELEMDGSYLTEKRIADLKNLRKFAFYGIQLDDLDGFEFDQLDELEFEEGGEKMHQFIAKHHKLTKLKTNFEKSAKFLEMPNHLPHLREIHLSTCYPTIFRETSFAVIVIMGLMKKCDELEAIVVRYQYDNCDEEESECVKLLWNAIREKFDRSEWHGSRHLTAENGSIEHKLHFQRKE